MAISFLYPQGKTKALTMSYDDGVAQDRRLVEIFNRNGLRGTFHLNSALLGQGSNRPHIEPEEVSTLYRGHEVACHSATHPFLERIPRTEVIREIYEDRRTLESLCGYPVVGMSYPFGTNNSEVIMIARAAGIAYSRGTVSTKRYSWPHEFMCWDATCHHREMLELSQGFINCRYKLALMYVWGHAYEFDDNDNWKDMEEFAQLMGSQTNIWYATNIEIYRYVQAIRGAETSVDGKMIYNPSATTLWVKRDEEILTVGPGEVKVIG